MPAPPLRERPDNSRQHGEALTLLREVERFHSAQHRHQVLLAEEARV
ncbi:hypothetical protein [Micromonospora musae]|nr:hypothetical protein [Micromonospora musae]